MNKEKNEINIISRNGLILCFNTGGNDWSF